MVMLPSLRRVRALRPAEGQQSGHIPISLLVVTMKLRAILAEFEGSPTSKNLLRSQRTPASILQEPGIYSFLQNVFDYNYVVC